MEAQISIEGFQAASNHLISLLQREVISTKAQLFDALREVEKLRGDLSDPSDNAIERAEASEARL